MLRKWNLRQQKKLLTHPAANTAFDFVQMVLDDPTEPLSQLADEPKRRIRDEVIADISEKLSRPAPTQAVRDQLAVYVVETTRFGVLLTTPETSMFKGITGELRDKISRLASINIGLKEFVYGLNETPATPSEMIECLYAALHHRNLYMRAYNLVRVELNDFHRDRKKDWYRPFLISQSIFWEYSYRGELNLPSNIEADKNEPIPGFEQSVLHGKWPEIVEAGHPHPRLVWETNWESEIGLSSPFAGIEV